MSGAQSDVQIRQARKDDAPAVAAFTQETWGDQHGDYVPDVFPQWVEEDGPTQQTFVVTLPAAALEDPGYDSDLLVESRRVVGCIQGVLLSDWEAWGQGIRVDPDARGFGVSRHLSAAVFNWAREQGASVCRNMVFSWNVPGLGQSRAVGFDPCTEFRFAQPAPNADATVDLPVAGGLDAAVDRKEAVDDPDPRVAWSFWRESAAHDHLRGLAMDDEESWALSALTRDQLREAADDGRLITVHDDGVAGMTYRSYTYDRENETSDDETGEDESGEDESSEVTTWAIYGVAAWRNEEAADALLGAISRDAVAVDAEETRVLIPETVGAVSDVAAARIPVSDEPDFVMAADLSDPAVGEVDR